jgi:hypothetical protein
MTRQLALLAGAAILLGVACAPTEQPSTTESVTWNEVRSSWGDRRDYTGDSSEGREAWSFYASASGTSSGTPSTSFDCHADAVVSHSPGLDSDGDPMGPSDLGMDSWRALGAPEGTATENYASLGFGGNIILEFNTPVLNVPGNDIYIEETSYGVGCGSYPEQAEIWVSQDMVSWTLAGSGCQDFWVDIAPTPWIRYVKVVDITDPDDFASSWGTLNGYDVDGVSATCGEACPDWLDSLSLGVSIEYSNHRGYAGTMPIYYIGDTMMADIEVCNPTTSTINNLTITTIEEALGSGTPLACGTPVSQWTGVSIAPGDCIVLSYSFLLATGCPWGNYQTHVVITRGADYACPDAVQIFNDEAVGIYDPPAGG